MANRSRVPHPRPLLDARRALVLAAITVALGCGGAATGPAASRASAATNQGAEGAAREPVATACAPEGSPLRYELLDLPASIVARTGARGACILLPSAAVEDELFTFVVELRARERQGSDELGVAPEERFDENDPIIARGELTVLGAPTRWAAIGGELPAIGEGEVRFAFVDLTRHTLDLTVSFAAATPEDVRREVIGALERLRVTGTERATDAWRYDPSRAACSADGAPLVVPVPEGAIHQTSWADQCMVGPPGDPADLPWSLWIGSVAVDSEIGASIAAEPGGTRAWAEGAFEGGRVVEERPGSFLGASTPLVSVDASDELGHPRRYVLARARHGERFLLVTISTAPGDSAHRAQLIEALAGVRTP